ncbi:MAG: fatty acid desaturase [Deltaproteobacteria bacterium]|nr:fatty acid desaturase [Deltaproteobacteria bacterium]
MPPAVACPSLVTTRPWTWPWWRAAAGQRMTLVWIVLIHVTAVVGVVVCPLPGWPLFLMAGVLTWVGGLGTTVCYHRALAHRALRLHPVVREVLTFFAMFNGSGAPLTWTANHRLHHATADTPEDVSSPRVGGFWWAHLRWLWQAGHATPVRYCPDLSSAGYRVWTYLQIPLLAFSFLGGLVFGPAAFFWLGAIRLLFALHGQCFVNSVCHLRPGTQPGQDSSQNVPWLALWHCFQGENWHRNHHARPGSARFGWTAAQLDLGWWVIVGLERLGLATEVRGSSFLRVTEPVDPCS